MSNALSLPYEKIFSTSFPAEARSAHSASRRNNFDCSATGSKSRWEQLTMRKKEANKGRWRDVGIWHISKSNENKISYAFFSSFLLPFYFSFFNVVSAEPVARDF